MKNFNIAKVLKPQGIKGEIKVECFTSDLDFLMSLKEFYIDDKKYTISIMRIQGKYGFIKTNEIRDRNDAELLRNKILVAEISDNTLNEDEYFISDLEECVIYDEFDNIIGYVSSIEKYGSADIINIMIGGASRAFPLLKAVLKEVDVKGKRIVVFKDKLEEVLIWK